jgi:hypothetical protein
MKQLKDVVAECNVAYAAIKDHYTTEFNRVWSEEKDWLINLEEKTHRLPKPAQLDIDYVIGKLKLDDFHFTNDDTSKLTVFTSKINQITKIANRINNFKEGVLLDNTSQLHLFELFNAIKYADTFARFEFTLNTNLKNFAVHLYSVVKHCQNPDVYPIYYRFWKNIMGEVLEKKDDYDSLCQFYKKIEEPKHLNLAAYFGVIGIILANKINENEIIKEEGDKNYKSVRRILNIHYFDLITNYQRKTSYFLVGSKYGEKNNVDIFPKMLERNVVSVGFAPQLDLTDLYLADEIEITSYLSAQNESQNSINALKHFLSMKPGDQIAVKGSGSPKGNKGFLSIAGICEVVKNDDGQVYSYDPDGLGHTINVHFTTMPIYKEFDIGGYGSTVRKMSNETHIKAIFFDTQEEIMNYQELYVKWAETTLNIQDGTKKQYVSSIGKLSELIGYRVFEEGSTDKIKALYDDLIREQSNPGSKY